MDKLKRVAFPLLAALFSNVTAKIIAAGVMCDPPNVGAKQATLEVQFVSEQMVPTGSYLKVTVPDGTSLKAGALRCAVTGVQNTDGLRCDAIENFVLFRMEVDLRAYEQNVYAFKDVFFPPQTTEPTSTFVVEIVASDKETVIAGMYNEIILSDLNPAPLPSGAAIVKQVDSGVVGDYTSMYLSVTPVNPIPAGGGLELQLPKWDAQAPVAVRQSYLEQFTTCANKLMVDTGLSCVIKVTPSSDVLILKDAFPNGLRAGETFSFYINQLRNPLSMSPASFKVTTFSQMIEGLNSEYSFDGLIDSGIAKLTASEPAKMDPTKCLISSDDSTVSEFTNFYIRFQVPVVVQGGCIILITLPQQDFSQDQFGALSYFNGWGIFGGFTDLNAQTDMRLGTIKIVDQCMPYSSADMATTIKISTIQNPKMVRQSKPFKIAILDSSNNLISQTVEGVTYTPTAGKHEDVEMKPLTSNDVSSLSTIQLKFTPIHPITKDSAIIIMPPADLKLTCDQQGKVGLKQNPECSQNSNGSLRLNNPFVDDQFGGEQLTLVFNKVALPNSQRFVTGLGIQTWQKYGDKEYLVDELDQKTSDAQYFQPNSVLFLYNSIETGSFDTFQETVFTFSFTLATEVPFKSVLYVLLPPQVYVTSVSDVQQSCKSVRGLASSMICTLKSQSNGKNLLTIINISTQNGFQANDELIFKVSKGLKTPISTQTSSTFEVVVKDQNGYEINYVNRALSITMRDGLDIGPIDVVAASKIVGEKTIHTIDFSSPVPLSDGFQFYVVIPNQLTPPFPSELKCTSKLPLEAELPCHLNGNRVTIDIQVDFSIKLENGGLGIQPGDQISLSVGQIQNPASLAPTSPYIVSIRSETSYEVAKQVTKGSSIAMSIPATITDFDFSVLDLRHGALTTVTISWTSTQYYPSDLSVSITYYPDEMYPKLAVDSNEVTCIINMTKIGLCKFVGSNQIIVEDLISSSFYPGQRMSITITNMIINVFTPMTTVSWRMATHLDEGRYAIDRIQTGLSLVFTCEYPCLTCDPLTPEVCDSCNTVDGFSILYEKNCYQECPPGTFFEYFQCKRCSENCKTCSKDSGIQCTSCKENGEFPYLNGNRCDWTCDFGFFGNRETGLCEQCQYPCESCVDTSTTCLSCNQQSVDKFLHNFSCEPECPLGYVAPFALNDNVCHQCNGCRSCEGTIDVCTTCGQGKILSFFKQNCVESCPKDVTILINNVCEVCDQGCPTCAGKIDFCTSCPEPLSLDKSQGECKLECDLTNQKMVSVDGSCQFCDDICLTCQDEQDQCVTCFPGKFLYNNDCVEKCPMKNDYQFEPNRQDICVIPGLICPFGYAVTPTGDGCALKAQICEDGFDLNYDKTKCIPVSPGYFPFPILILTCFICVIPIVSKVRNRESKLVANLIVAISVTEPIGLIMQYVLSDSYGIKPAVYLTGFAILMHFATNLFFGLVYTKQVKSDQSFKHWQAVNQKVSFVVQVLGLWNYKIFRLLYSRLFGRDEFDAPLEAPMVFYRPFNLSSLFTLITVFVPSMIGSGFGVIYVMWGYQLLITCFELLTIHVLLLILQIVEYFLFKFEQKKYYRVDRRQADIKVQSGYMSDSSEEEFNIRDKVHKPKALKQVKKLERLVMRVRGKELERGELVDQDAEKQIDELHELEIMQRQFRRCRSFRMQRPSLQEIWGSDHESDCEKFQDFISEPGSPRSKEMLINGGFLDRMHELKRAYKMRDKFDNVYAEAKKPMRKKKFVDTENKRVQTNVLELLGIDDIRNQTVDDSAKTKPKSKQSDKSSLSTKRLSEIPKFELSDIQGDFECDSEKNYMLVQKKGKLYDKKSRQVNRRGYTVDRDGNVVNRKGKIIFYQGELNQQTDEIPKPFCNKKQTKLKGVNGSINFKVESLVVEKSNSDLRLESDFSKLDQKSTTQVEPVQITEVNTQTQQEQETEVRDDEDEYIKKICEPKKAKTKQELVELAKVNSPHPINESVEFVEMRESQLSLHTAQPVKEGVRFEQLKETQSYKDLVFVGSNQKASNYGGHSAFKNKVAHISPEKYMPGKEMMEIYKRDLSKIDQSMHNLRFDQQYVSQIENYNSKVTQKRQEYLKAQSRASLGKIKQGYIANEAGDEDQGLARKNLTNIYGRVRNKYNQQIRQGGAALKFNPVKARGSPKLQKMSELEEIYLNPRVKESRMVDQDISRAMKDIHHQRDALDSGSQLQHSGRGSLAERAQSAKGNRL